MNQLDEYMMNIIVKTFKKVFWIVFIVAAFVVEKIIFDSIYPALTNGYKPTLILPKLSSEPKEITDTERYGHITSYEVWSGEIRVTGDIVVAKNTTLTIRPGTTVLVAANSDKDNLMTVPE